MYTDLAKALIPLTDYVFCVSVVVFVSFFTIAPVKQ